MTENPQPRTLQKWWKFCTISKCAKKIFFGKILCSTHQKEVFLQTFRLFLENWIFDGKSTAADLTKMVKILYYLKMCWENIFGQNSLFHSSKEVFLKTFKAGFGKLNFWPKIHSRGPYKNGENFVLFQNVLRKYFLAKFFDPLIKRSVSTTFKAGLWKIELLMENPQPRTLQKCWKFCTISKCAKKIFFGKILCSTHQKKCFYKLLRQFMENWIFDGKSTAADLTKMVKILYYLKMC